MMNSVEYRSSINAPAKEVFAWHWNPGTMSRLIPPWESVEVLQPAPGPEDGAIAVLRIGMGLFNLHWNWVARHGEFVKDEQFADEQVSGPFAHWHHLHRMEPLGPEQSCLVDTIEYELIASVLSQPMLGDYVKAKIDRMFEYRHKITVADLKVYTELGGRSMKILVSGSHGLVGTQLTAFLRSQGHTVCSLVREAKSADEILWDPEKGQIDKSKLEGFDAVVHLAGENIASGRWTAAKKERIRNSRIKGTRLLCEALASLTKPPQVLVSGSAIGFYGDRGDEILTEQSAAGSGFLAEVCKDWEAATAPAKEKGIRVAFLRTGVVLSTRGGALTKMLPPFLLGAGGILGSGKQYMSWISLDDLTGIIQHIITHDEIIGPVNAVVPQAVTNKQFTADLGKSLHRPTIFPVPGFAAHLLLGEMADELLLSSARVRPDSLIASSYNFRQPDLLQMLNQLFNNAA